jgi:hypothetical protein
VLPGVNHHKFSLHKEVKFNMAVKTAKETVVIPKEEYRILKEVYRNVKRQQFLMRLDEAEKNLRAGKVKKVAVETFIEGI